MANPMRVARTNYVEKAIVAMAAALLFAFVWLLISGEFAQVKKYSGATEMEWPSERISSEEQKMFYQCNGANTHHTSSLYSPDNEGQEKFLAILNFQEQLTKGRLHFAEAVNLAKSSQRTLVLPNVSNGCMGSYGNYRLPFCTYFDLKNEEWGKWVTMDYFLDTVAKRADPKTFTLASIIWEDEGKVCSRARVYETLKSKARYQRPWPFLDSLQSPMFTCTLCQMADGTRAGEATKEFLSLQGADLVVIYNAETKFCVPQYETHAVAKSLSYADHLQKVVRSFRLSKLPQGYVAIYWEFEKALTGWRSATTVERCWEGLVRTIDRNMRKWAVEHVILITDVQYRSR
eukprot:TRINITY_DN2183_c0_g5_i1.p1 TRINITY_DN2183_c0_g5~~TRINITY_DN2183_c0_g5_i1.p1  ORF type:complete len:346 (+),score=28.61 TRINITY_DN2183_c0_g5_i1:2005-3042(+)